MFTLAEYGRKTDELIIRTKDLISQRGDSLLLNEDETGTIRVAIVGPYSAGKSSIIKMLTGIEDIPIGQKVVTQSATTYHWNGIDIVDTPGIHTELYPDHDERSYKEISGADLLVFVITSSLFDSHLAEHFRKLAIDKEKASEMLLVVNKMGETSGGNTKEQQSALLGDLRKLLSPYTPEQLNTCFIDAKTCLQGFSIKDSNAALAETLVNRSGYESFIDTLNGFVAEKGVLSKLTTKLYTVDHYLENKIEELQPENVDSDLVAYEESLIQQRHLLVEARGRISQEVKDVYTIAAAHVKEIGLETSELMSDGCIQEDVEKGIEDAVNNADDIIEKCQEDALKKLEERLNELGIKFEDIENSEFSQKLKAKLIDKYSELPANVQAALFTAAPQLQKAGQAVVEKAFAQGAQGGMKLANFSGSSVHQLVLKAGQKVGYKFKPWQAIKFTKGVAVAGEALNVFGIALGVFMQIKSDKDQERVRQYLKLNRQNIRGQFSAAANELEDQSLLFVKDNVEDLLAPSIEEIDKKLQAIRDTQKERDDYLKKLEELHQECCELIGEIHAI